MSESQSLSADLAGVHVALFTPLLRDDPKRLRNGIDWEKAGVMIDDLLAVGVDGIVPVGTTGQSPTVTPQQQLEFIRFVLDRVQGRARVIAGAGSNCTRESVDMIAEIQKLAAGTPCLCVTGYYNNPPQQGLLDHFETIVAETGAPLVLYNVPSRAANYIEPDTLIALAANPLVIGVKQAVDFIQPGRFRDDTVRVIEATRDLDFAVITGEDEGLFPILEMGGTGIISATANIPEAAHLYKNLLAQFASGDRAGAQATQQVVNGFAKWVFARKNPIPLGTLFGSPLYQPLPDMENTENGKELVQQMHAWMQENAPSLGRWN